MLLPINEIKEIDQIKDFKTRIHQAALLYSRAGIHVVPLRPNTKILPEKRTGINYQSCSNKPKTMDNWFGEGGKYRGYNIGIICGKEEGVFAIDLDLHNPERNGKDTWAELTRPHLNHDSSKIPTQQTPTGGQHMLFRWRQNLTSSSEKLGPGVDTRGGDGVGRSHVVGWPSHVEWEEDGEQKEGTYSWVGGGEVPETPQWVSDLMGVPWIHKPGRGNEEVGQDDEENHYSLSQIAAMLDHVDANLLSYEEWLFIGQAINSQHPNKEGLELWDGWSANGERYVQGECHKRWTGFNPSGTIRMGSLIYFAKQGGYNNLADLARTGDFDEITERMNIDNAVLLTGGKVRIVHRDQRGGIHIMGTQDFNTLMYNRKVTIPGARGTKTVTEADLWMAAPERRECIRGMGFFPNEELWYDGYCNLWQGWGVEPKEGNWQFFNNHILEILCGNDEKLHTFVLDWMADLLQDPMNPKGTAIVMKGKEGTGKGTFCELMGKLVGKQHYKHVTNERHLTGNFNYHLMDGLLVFADEVIYGGSRQTAGILKSMVTEKMLVCERKGVDSFMYENRARLVVASNEDWVIPAGPESRRWLVLEVSDKYANRRSYFDAMYEQMEKGGYAAMMFDLLNRQITSNLNIAIQTQALEHQRAIYKATGDAVDIWMDRCIAKHDLGTPDEGEGGWPTNVGRMELFEAFDMWLDGKKSLRSKGVAHFYRKVESYGFRKHRPRPEGGGIRKWAYRVPDHDTFST